MDLTLVLQAWLAVVILCMALYTVRHAMFSYSRAFQKQRPSFGDAYDCDLPSIAVLVPMHNEGTVAQACLTSLLKTDYPPEKLVIVPLNDHSTDDTAEIVARFAGAHACIRPITIDGPIRGKSNALNVALSTLDTELVLVFDADYTPGPGVFRQLVSAFIDPEVGAVMGRVVPRNTAVSLLTRLLSMERSGGYQVDQQARRNLDLIPQYGGTVAGFRMDVVRQIGGFDPTALSEDTELTAAILAQGFRVAYDNRAECFEEVPETYASRFKQLRRWSRGHNRVLFRHLASMLSSPDLTHAQRLDFAMLLLCYVLPAVLVSGMVAELLLFCMGRLPFGVGVGLAFCVVLYNTFGNFSPIYQVATAELLDGSSWRLLLLPYLFYTFPFNSWTITTGLLDAFGDAVKRRRGEWEKTVRSGSVLSS